MIILTGGAGFIGSCFLQKLNSNNITNITVVDNLGNSEKWKNLIGKKFVDFIHKDIFLEKIRNNHFDDNIQVIFHFGACTDTTERNADYMLYNNYIYSKELAKYAIRNNIRFIYSSSAATYGNGENGYDDTEFYNLKPLNIYGYSKHLFDLWVKENNYDSYFTGLKFFNVFGPNEYHKNEMASMVYKSYKQVLEYNKIRLFKSNHKDYKDGEQKRDFIYVKDVVEVIWNIYNSNISGIYNLGTGQASTWNQLAYAVFNSLGKEINIEYVDMPENLTGQYQNFTQADMKRLKTKNVLPSFYSLNEAIEDYIKNYLTKNWQYI